MKKFPVRIALTFKVLPNLTLTQDNAHLKRLNAQGAILFIPSI